MKNQYQPNQFIETEGGYFSGKIRFPDGTIFGVITAPKAQGEFSSIWLPEYKDVPGASSCFDSRANTLAMAEAGSEAAQKALAAEINGHKDWVIGARDIVEVQYRAHKPTQDKNHVYRSGDNPSSVPVGYPYTRDLPAQTIDALFKEGGSEAFECAWYGTSTQSGASGAWNQYFDNGNQDTSSKGNEFVFRLVRLIQLDA